MGLPSVMNRMFQTVPAPQIQRSQFDKSGGHKSTFDAGFLVPVLVDEVLPGDTKNIKASFVARLSTLLFPIMDNVFLDTFWFFVPNRILWTNWERFNGAQDNPGDSIDFEVPTISGDPLAVAAGDLLNHMGVPVIAACPDISALPVRAYNRIWNEWFRDENLQDSVPQHVDDGPDPIDDYTLLRRGKRHDYFTSCLPWPQKGDAVSIPLGTTAPVIGDGNALGLDNGGDLFLNYNDSTGFNGVLGVSATGGAVGTAPAGAVPTGDIRLGLGTNPLTSHAFADLSSASAATLAQLREAIAIQQILERDARGGTRYTEILKSRFGVTVPDFRLQRPEYLGGSSQMVNVNQVAQTAPVTGTGVGNLAAYGHISSNSGFVKSFDEHGWIIGLVNVRADITYQQGLNRMWTRSTRYDFYDPLFAHLGEQPVLQKEIYLTGTPGTDPGQDDYVFGYQERYAEMRSRPSTVAGQFCSEATLPLDAWHLALHFGAAPQLDEIFIEDDPPLGRVMQLGEEAVLGQQVLIDCYFKYLDARPMPVRGIPGLQRL